MMRRASVRAYAKINLLLTVVGRRGDGYHELRTVYQTVSLADRLTFEWPVKTLSLVCDAREVPAGEENLVLRAARAYGRAAGRTPRVRIRLEKRIPSRAGLGGGSSDAAVTLLALNALGGKRLPDASLVDLAAGLGSDVPFFLVGGTALGLGRGEIVRPLADLEPSSVLLAVPPFGISTREAFSRVAAGLTPRARQTSIYRFSRQWVTASRGFGPARNDLEQASAGLAPALAGLIQTMRAAGATDVAMTGSGSAVYGMFAGRDRARAARGRLAERWKDVRALVIRTVGAREYGARVLGIDGTLRAA
jgi:4-diphosphocytidyl-2-C-methyl-D-erythritol kinase